MALRSSRTLPGQSCASSSCAASAPRRLGEAPPPWRRKCSASSSTSPRRSRSGGRCTGTTWSRYQRSSRKRPRSEEHTSELQSQSNLVCRLLLEKKKKNPKATDLNSCNSQIWYDVSCFRKQCNIAEQVRILRRRYIQT